jgi:hypothetical protein
MQVAVWAPKRNTHTDDQQECNDGMMDFRGGELWILHMFFTARDLGLALQRRHHDTLCEMGRLGHKRKNLSRRMNLRIHNQRSHFAVLLTMQAGDAFVVSLLYRAQSPTTLLRICIYAAVCAKNDGWGSYISFFLGGGKIISRRCQ